MPKRSRTKTPKDLNELASFIVGESTKESQSDLPQKNPAAVALGRLGGRKGGPARAEKLTPEQRSEIAKKAAEVRWQRKPHVGQP